ncbi:MAG: YafY family transcriptional regulator [Clostridia bacterium]|jgi:predicted DNA-binding transcriptional regulator YafY|nr:YafY family transcriptional regulator [Clostridia bacterium]
MKINRLFEIVYLLLERKTLTAKELSEYFGVSIRTIYRDIDILSTANIPIYTSKGKNGGISLLDSYVFDKSILLEEEQNEILFALQSLEKLGIDNEKKILQKMNILFNKVVKNWIEIDFSHMETDEGENKKFHDIKQAILNKKVIEFIYFNSLGEKTKRQVEPLQICFKDKAWYVKAYCKLREDYRVFKITRIKDAKVLNETFERENLTKYKEQTSNLKIVSLEVKIAKEKAYRVYDEFEIENIKTNDDGDFIVKFSCPDNDWIYEYILSFGEYIKVISPNYVKEVIKEKIQKMVKNYL